MNVVKCVRNMTKAELIDHITVSHKVKTEGDYPIIAYIHESMHIDTNIGNHIHPKDHHVEAQFWDKLNSSDSYDLWVNGPVECGTCGFPKLRVGGHHPDCWTANAN